MDEPEFQQRFDEIWEEMNQNSDDTNHIGTNELQDALQRFGSYVQNFRIREMTTQLKNEGKISDAGISKVVFLEIAKDHWKKDSSRKFKAQKQVKGNEDLVAQQGKQGYTYHMISIEEQRGFCQWINHNLEKDPQLSHLLPLNLEQNGDDLYQKVGDGILLCKMINYGVPETIDVRAINVGKKLSIFKKHENLTLAIQSAKAIGLHVIGVDSHTFSSGEEKKHLVLGLIWQLIALVIMGSINLQENPGLIALLKDGESIDDFLKLSPEQILLRWVNFQLERTGCSERINNFSQDIRDSVIYTNLLNQIAPAEANVTKNALKEENLVKRAEKTLEEADKMDCNEFVTPQDIVNGQERLNLAFVANLFNKFPALEEPAEAPIIQESREEKMFRNWMNSLGVQPFVQYLYSDLQDGLILFQIYEFIQPGLVNWKRVVGATNKEAKDLSRSFSKIGAKKNLEILGNCNYAVELGKKINLILVGIEGNDIKEGNRTLTLGLIWQLMRKYTLTLLAKLSPDGTPIVETEIITWANQRLEGKGVTIRHFGDSVIKDALPVMHLIDSMKSGVIDYSIIKSGSQLDAKDRMSNAKYAITMARRIGAPVYALPEDITEVKHKMVMTIFAGLMLVDMSYAI